MLQSGSGSVPACSLRCVTWWASECLLVHVLSHELRFSLWEVAIAGHIETGNLEQ